MTNVKRVDFGKDIRDAQRSFARLLKICEDHDAELANDPRRLYEEAAREICKLSNVIMEAKDALNYLMPECSWPGDIIAPMKTVRVTKEDYDRWKRCEKILDSFNL